MLELIVVCVTTLAGLFMVMIGVSSAIREYWNGRKADAEVQRVSVTHVVHHRQKSDDDPADFWKG